MQSETKEAIQMDDKFHKDILQISSLQELKTNLESEIAAGREM